jgi:hypothetical protein
VFQAEVYLFDLKAGRYGLLKHGMLLLFYPTLSNIRRKKIRTVHFLTVTGHAVARIEQSRMEGRLKEQ